MSSDNIRIKIHFENIKNKSKEYLNKFWFYINFKNLICISDLINEIIQRFNLSSKYIYCLELNYCLVSASEDIHILRDNDQIKIYRKNKIAEIRDSLDYNKFELIETFKNNDDKLMNNEISYEDNNRKNKKKLNKSQKHKYEENKKTDTNKISDENNVETLILNDEVESLFSNDTQNFCDINDNVDKNYEDIYLSFVGKNLKKKPNKFPIENTERNKLEVNLIGNICERTDESLTIKPLIKKQIIDDACLNKKVKLDNLTDQFNENVITNHLNTSIRDNQFDTILDTNQFNPNINTNKSNCEMISNLNKEIKHTKKRKRKKSKKNNTIDESINISLGSLHNIYNLNKLNDREMNIESINQNKLKEIKNDVFNKSIQSTLELYKSNNHIIFKDVNDDCNDKSSFINEQNVDNPNLSMIDYSDNTFKLSVESTIENNGRKKEKMNFKKDNCHSNKKRNQINNHFIDVPIFKRPRVCKESIVRFSQDSMNQINIPMPNVRISYKDNISLQSNQENITVPIKESFYRKKYSRLNDLENTSIHIQSLISENDNLKNNEIKINDSFFYPLLTNPPNQGDLILFKILELGEGYTPTVSEYKLGEVEKFESSNKVIHLQIIQENKLERKEGRFDITVEDEIEILTNTTPEVDKIVLIWTNLIEPRLFKENI